MNELERLFQEGPGGTSPQQEEPRRLRQFIHAVDFCVVDLETTGMNPRRGAEMIEIGAVRIEDGELSDTFHQLVEPRRPVPAHITDLTGITNRMVSGKPSVGEVLPSFVEFAGNAVLIAHNFSFDFSFLDFYHHESFYNDFICTVKLARNVADYESNSLDHLVPQLELDRDDAHRALDDALATGKLFRRLTGKVTEPEDYHRAGIPVCLHQLDPGALAMHVEGIGKRKAHRIARAFETSSRLIEASEEQVRSLDGIGPALAGALTSFARDFSTVSPGRRTPLTRDRKEEPAYDEHHRDAVPDLDDVIQQTD